MHLGTIYAISTDATRHAPKRQARRAGPATALGGGAAPATQLGPG